LIKVGLGGRGRGWVSSVSRRGEWSEERSYKLEILEWMWLKEEEAIK
jgi:hypothetical protein